MTDEFTNLMVANGYKMQKMGNETVFYKSTGSDNYCHCNDKPPQFLVKMHELFLYGGAGDIRSVTIDVRGEINGDWYNFEIYSIPVDKFMVNIQEYEKKILTVWDGYLNNDTNTKTG